MIGLRWFHGLGLLLVAIATGIGLWRGVLPSFYCFPVVCIAFVPFDLFVGRVVDKHVDRSLNRPNHGPLEQLPVVGPLALSIRERIRNQSPRFFTAGAGVTFVMFCGFCVLAALEWPVA